MTKPVDPKEFRRAYVPDRRPLAAGLSRGARGEQPGVEADCLAIVTRWNERIPVHRVRVLTQERYDLVRTALGTFGRDEILAAVEFYAAQEWQRSKGAWKRFDNFFTLPALTLWVEVAMAAAEKAEARAAPKDPRVANLAGQIAATQTAWNRHYELGRRYDALPVTAKRRLWDKARGQLQRAGKKLITAGQIRDRALEIMEDEEAEKETA